MSDSRHPARVALEAIHLRQADIVCRGGEVCLRLARIPDVCDRLPPCQPLLECCDPLPLRGTVGYLRRCPPVHLVSAKHCERPEQDDLTGLARLLVLDLYRAGRQDHCALLTLANLGTQRLPLFERGPRARVQARRLDQSQPPSVATVVPLASAGVHCATQESVLMPRRNPALRVCQALFKSGHERRR